MGVPNPAKYHIFVTVDFFENKFQGDEKGFGTPITFETPIQQKNLYTQPSFRAGGDHQEQPGATLSC